MIEHSKDAYMGVSKNNGTPKSSILIGFSIINHPFWGNPIFWKHPYRFTFTYCAFADVLLRLDSVDMHNLSAFQWLLADLSMELY